MTTPQTGPAGPAGADSANPEAGIPLIREWHTMTADEQAAAWTDLIAWVAWIHDLYELSREERLPLCWPQHPGLVEELRGLKAWRDLIYDNPEAASAPHTARSWHGELRQTVAAAIGFWAPGCRTGHRDAVLLADAQPDRREKWLAAGPPMMASAPKAAAVAVPAVRPEVISTEDMFAALKAGTAVRHSRSVPHYIRYENAWWTRGKGGTDWLRCHDEQGAFLDRTSQRLSGADAAHDRITNGKDQ
ncbi:hypothetical protein [Actinoplanes regularis]|uniref:Uncharacterized protein n=1 Tax=Actinoplanes regularis TaxID=52697 RepID=A0A238XIL1_9ACTN|nr:hypothetical protein [Actinoplanes regularis]GIE86833.1 hypothetical protein Are01nite_33130 [Actinoplanes regularis]SNR58313.1 hypothetical protein SAMN06264365_103459 [Actinoplanes regularis]